MTNEQLIEKVGAAVDAVGAHAMHRLAEQFGVPLDEVNDAMHRLIERVGAVVDAGSSLLAFVNKFGEIEKVERQQIQADATDERFCLLEKAQRWSNPYFEICQVVNHEVFIANESVCLNDPATFLIALLTAVGDAHDARTSFYETREQEFGPDAWPTREEREAAQLSVVSVS